MHSEIMLRFEEVFLCLLLLSDASVNGNLMDTEHYVDHDNSSKDRFSSDQIPFVLGTSNSTCSKGSFPQIPVCFPNEISQNSSMSFIPPTNCEFYQQNPKFMICNNKNSDFNWTLSELDYLRLVNHFTLVKIPNFSNVFVKYVQIYAEELTFINTGGFSDRILGLEVYGGILFAGIGTIPYKHFWDSFKGFPNLVRLTLSNNYLSFSFVDKAPEKPMLEKLEFLSFVDNTKLDTLHDKVFYPLRNSPLKELNLRNCHINYIGLETFTYLKKLTHLDLHGNKELFTLGAKFPLCLTIYPVIHNIQTLGLSGVDLLFFPLCLIKKFKASKIEVLNLSNNIYQSLGYFMNKFMEMPYLKVLIIDNSEVIHIKNDTFQRLGPNLKTLSLRKNHINKFWPGLILPSLEYLDLSYQREISGQNPEFIIQPHTFTQNKMHSLKVLRLRGLRTTKIKRFTFEGLDNLKQLDLSDSLIEEIETFSMIHLRNLEKLELSNCQSIKSLKRESLTGLHELRYLDISNTKIFIPKINEYLPRNSRVPIKLEFLNLSNSFEDIKEDISGVQRFPSLWSDLVYLKTLDLSRNRIVPWERPIFLENKYLQALFLRDNDITYLSPSMLNDFSNLNFLDLRKNLGLTCGLDVTKFHNLTLNHRNLKVPDYRNGSGIFCHIPRNNDKDKFISFKDLFDNYTAYFPPEEDDDESTSFWTNQLMWISVIIGSLSSMIAIVYVYSNRYFICYRWTTSQDNMNLGQKENTAYIYDAFISYCDKDRDWVFSELIPHLEEDFKVCVHERDFKVGMMVVDNIVNCIDKSRRFIAILSPSFVKSKWCAFETHVAQMRMKKSNEQFLVVVKDKVPKNSIDKGLSYIMKTWTYIKWPNVYCKTDRSIFWNRVREGIF